MQINSTLTDVLNGRTVTAADVSDGRTEIGFDDGSRLVVQTVPGAQNCVSRGGTVCAVRQSVCELSLDLKGGGSLEINPADVDSGIIVRAQDGTVRYGD